MKYLITILLLLSFNAFTLTHQEIDDMTIWSNPRFFTQEAYPECKYVFLNLDTETPTLDFAVYEEDKPECKPEMSVVVAKLDEFKIQYHKDETYREELVAKKLEAKSLFLQVRPHFHLALKKTGLKHVSNPDAWIRDNCRRAKTHEKVDICINKFQSLVNQLPIIQAEIDTENKAKSQCNINVTAVQNFNVNTIDGMNTAQLKNVIKNMAKIIKCRIK